ncbi:hypothetical protein HYT55_05195 [Candidatus Woesearchaeota archaeon]|nr:hypothetical protein [Candidatus Woesearchaeota archaeon]
MDIKASLERFVERFHPEEYVLGGGLAVALQTGQECLYNRKSRSFLSP